MRLYISDMEFVYSSLVIVILTTIIDSVIGILFFKYIIYLYAIIFSIALIVTAIYYYKSITLPGAAKYNVLGYIELHIENKHKGNKKKFYGYCSEIIMTGYREKKDILIDTWVTPKRMMTLFGDSVEIRPFPLTLFIPYMVVQKRYRKNVKLKQMKMYRYVILTNRFGEKEIERLNGLMVNC